ncbi:xanthine dehydrogenase family protein molybdopterin-binding subunit [Nocardia sp. alder85J]|uniref:xanthine dehydrogenase family protein molybdopterin-binding subunit n=1 Tax=Nocardia sp. alder85J TaxID=2862949 RepID=UPI001CD60619|nr:xanthine dehydrogenase family protein molybdopterin-binding subunit [Nocardia sp. alder85J]MCX4095204.1 xanthine dehydrogenase family protein molybdopterin-binding subunit [Nocardia sp. alder85J]
MTTGTATAGVVGARIPRIEDLRLVTGAGEYVDDIVRPGMAHVHFVRSPLARARILDIDVSEALALEGVRAVYTAADLNPEVRELVYALDLPGMPPVPRPPLAEGEVRFVGDPVALIVAVDRYVAEDAAELVVVDYDPLPPIVDYTTAAENPEQVHPDIPANLAALIPGMPAEQRQQIYDKAAHVVRQHIFQQGYVPVPMETRGLIAEWSAPTGEMTIWASTQSPHGMRAFCARLLGIPEHQVRVVARDTGGGFGQKVVPGREDVAVMLAARKLRASLKWIEDRQENLIAAGSARHESGIAEMAFDADGRILFGAIDYLQNVGAYPIPSPLTAAFPVGMLFTGPYRVPVATFDLKLVYTNTVGRVAYRGPWQFESVAREVLMDTAARQIGIDPVELRRRNMIRQDELPMVNPSGMPYSDMTPLETFEKAVGALGYEAFREEQAAARAQGRYLGVGSCTYVEPTAGSTPFYATEGGTIRIEPSGVVNVYVAGGSAGNSLETTVVQLTADALGVRVEDVHTIQGDTAVTPFGGGTGGSRSASVTAGAIAETAAALRARIIAIAAHKLGNPAEDIEFADGRATVRGVPEVALTLHEIAEIAYFQPDALPPGIPAGLEASGRYKAAAPMIWANATHICTCEVDIETGRVTLLRYIVGEDVGPMINPNVVEGQIYGGTVQGIGGALYESQAYDDDGNPIATTFMDYLLPTATEAPTIEVVHVESHSAGPGGFKGVGEGGAIGSAPAVINAVADALAPFGVEISALPLSPATIVGLIDAARGKAHS